MNLVPTEFLELIGHELTEDVVSKLDQWSSGIRILRIYPEGSILSMDLNILRLNVVYDESNIITNIWVG